eukprot:TRINITY_DN4677_c0_g1_i1.p1 TRINITY_DN4677_c0_g1~~TRINITY_DN4677_c0_g1_i1.p1  ORF type:complete len:458 (-),score=82.74 TRINITY_DN4677_c0_g1_i1:304-1677(-)
MENKQCRILAGILFVCSLAALVGNVEAYDALDPTGNVTIVWDITSWTGDGYIATVKLWNYQQFRRIESPGWKLNWNWTHGEVIWSIAGAEAAFQGDCSKLTFPGGNIPHCCLQYPTILDLLDVPENANVWKNCCKSGLLSAFAQNPGDALASFQITVGNATNTIWTALPPQNFSLGIDGYTCTPPLRVNSTLLTSDSGRRFTQALVTWKVVCTYNRLEVKKLPSCCISLSAFYNTTIIPCSSCACACGNYSDNAAICKVASDDPPYLVSSDGSGVPVRKSPSALLCSPDGCPVSIHFHLKVNYKSYWRAKLTVINRSLYTNYTGWNLAMEHPGLTNLTEVFSWHVQQIQPFGVNNTAVFWGLKMYNDILMPAGRDGNVQSEMLIEKTPDFTLENGWAFPRKIIFNGEECVMPEEFPALPPGVLTTTSAAAALSSPLPAFALSLLTLILFSTAFAAFV